MQLFIFIPNLFFVNSRLSIFFIVVITILFLVLASINTLFLYLLWIYFAIINFCFAYFYILHEYKNNFYFEGNDLDAQCIFTYFLII